MPRRPIAANVALAIIVPIIIGTTTTAASADDVCSTTASLPRKLVIDKPITQAPLVIHDSFGCVDWVDYELSTPEGHHGYGHVFDGELAWNMRVYSFQGPGLYFAKYTDGYDTDFNRMVGFPSNLMDARFGSRFTLNIERDGGQMHFNVKAKTLTQQGTWAPWVAAHIHIQRLTLDGWRDVKSEWTDYRGQSSWSMTASRARWRAVLSDSPTTRGGETTSIRL